MKNLTRLVPLKTIHEEKNFGQKIFAKCRVHLPSDQNLTKIFPLSDFVADSLKRCAIKNEYGMQSLKNIHRAVKEIQTKNRVMSIGT